MYTYFPGKITLSVTGGFNVGQADSIHSILTSDSYQVADDLTLVRGRRHGLLCNPHSQECRMAGERVPLPWIDTEEPATPETKRPRKRSTPSPRSKR